MVKLDIRPERPDDDEAPQLTDVLWKLAERCWAKKPMARPSAEVVCDAISHEILNTKIACTGNCIDQSTSSAHPTPEPVGVIVGDHPCGNPETIIPESGAGVQEFKEKVCGIP